MTDAIETSATIAQPKELLPPTLKKEARAHAIEILTKSFVNPENPDNILPFHGVWHTKNVVKQTKRILSIFKNFGLITPHEMEIGILAAWYHDAVQMWTEQNGKRIRTSGDNEELSASTLIAFMKSSAHPFSDADEGLVRTSIDATVASFDLKDMTIHQLRAEDPGASWLAKAIAMADLGLFGVDPKAFIRTGFSLFREDNMDITRAARDNWASTSDEEKKDYTRRMVNFLQFQITLVETQTLRFETYFFKPLEAESPDAAAKLRAYFSKSKKSLKFATDNYIAGTSMSFDKLTTLFGYSSIIPDNAHRS